MFGRLLVGVLSGVAMTLVLFFLMHLLVSNTARQPDTGGRRVPVEMVRIPVPEEVTPRARRTLPKPPPPQQLQPALSAPAPTLDGISPDRLALAPPRMQLPTGSGGQPAFGTFSAGDMAEESDVVPLVQVPPMFPHEARLRGIQGWVRIRFTITRDGSVSHPTVVEAQPRRVFDREALRAIERWKFTPRIVAGEAVEREAEQVIEFRIEGN